MQYTSTCTHALINLQLGHVHVHDVGMQRAHESIILGGATTVLEHCHRVLKVLISRKFNFIVITTRFIL